MNNDLLIRPQITVKDAMKQMGKAGERVLFVVDVNNKLLGSLTDGDIRRWILADGDISDTIGNIYNKKPVTLAENYNINDVKEVMLANKIEGMPVIDSKKRVLDVVLWDAIFDDNIVHPKGPLDVTVAIMAGGKGTRLDPFTRILPKPLIPIGDKPIIDIIMERFNRYGINDFYITINHKSRMIKSYFEEMNTSNVIHYVEEREPLGTAGSLKFIKNKIKDTLLVTNCDIIIKADYSEILEFHNAKKCDMTIVGSFRHHTVPYGICEIENGGLLKSLIEKPEYDFLVNTGMYLIRKNALDLIPKNRMFHITDLIATLKKKKKRIGVFPLGEKAWIDIGQWEEYRHAVRELGIDT